jgi:Uncharacterised protein family UPF0547
LVGPLLIGVFGAWVVAAVLAAVLLQSLWVLLWIREPNACQSCDWKADQRLKALVPVGVLLLLGACGLLIYSFTGTFGFNGSDGYKLTAVLLALVGAVCISITVTLERIGGVGAAGKVFQERRHAVLIPAGAAFLVGAVGMGAITATVAPADRSTYLVMTLLVAVVGILLIVAYPIASAVLAGSEKAISSEPRVQAVTDADGEMKTCPDCAEQVKAAARKCRFCGHMFE